MAKPNLSKNTVIEFPDTGDTSDREIVTSRVFDAPRELVWEAWINPEQIGKWWGPNGFTTTTSKMEVKPGGRLAFCHARPGWTGLSE